MLHATVQMNEPTRYLHGTDAALAEVARSLSRSEISVAARWIADGDEDLLLTAEAVDFRHAVQAVRRQSGAARHLARLLLRPHGFAQAAIPRNAARAPIWPAGIVGSMAHERHVVISAVASMARVRSVGIDIEAAEPLPADVALRVARPSEMRGAIDDLHCARLFVVKEAVFKAVHPIDGMFLDFHDIAVDLEAGTAHTGYGRSVSFDLVCGSHITALARVDS